MPSLFLLDISGYLFRSFYALPEMRSPSGRPVQALHGLFRSIAKIIEDFRPDHLVAIFDGKEGKKRRQAIYPDYKIHRSQVPEDLLEQILLAPALCRALGLQTLIDEAHEADDLIAAATQKGKQKGCRVYICSSDKDLLQLVEENVFVLQTHKENQLLGREKVKELLGVEPSQVLDWLALAGDSADNIPGVAGIGVKRAAQLLERWGTLENLVENLDRLGAQKKKFDLTSALLSKKLATLFFDFEFTLDWTPFVLSPPNVWRPLFQEIGLRAIIKKLQPKEAEQSTKELSAPPQLEMLFAPNPIRWEELLLSLQKLPEGSLLQIECFSSSFWIVRSESKLSLLREEPSKEEAEKLASLKLLWQTSDIQKTQIALEKSDPSSGRDLVLPWHDDLLLAADLFYTDSRALTVAKIVDSFQESEQGRFLFEEASKGDFTSGKKLMELFSQAQKEILLGLDPLRLQLYRDLEVPLASLLAKLHRRGFYLDRESLAPLSLKLGKKIEETKLEISALLGDSLLDSINLNSPKQLGSLLFEKLGLPVVRRTKKAPSTDNKTLLEIQGLHPIVDHLLKYRELEKLRSTYVDALPTFVGDDGVLHPFFEQTTTATGRLSCRHPNLQNIPIKTPEGREIRSCFRAKKPTDFLLSADYSQIELRMMAHLSQDISLIEAFSRGEDIHRYTAALLFCKRGEDVLASERSIAKAVNFGVLYGQQAFSLSKQLGISLEEASSFIKAYFERYSGVQRYLQECRRSALELGYVATLLGRRRAIPEIKSAKHSLRQLGERLSGNTPVQGSAAELIKVAMLALENLLKGSSIRMILQVHDELIFEGSLEVLQQWKESIAVTMEQALPLQVPLVVNIGIGKNWEEC